MDSLAVNLCLKYSSAVNVKNELSGNKGGLINGHIVDFLKKELPSYVQSCKGFFSGKHLFERCVETLKSTLPRLISKDTAKANSLISLEGVSQEIFESTPLLKILGQYSDVPLRDLLSTIQYDLENQTTRFDAAMAFTEMMSSDCRLVKKSSFQRVMEYGSGAGDTMEVYPRLQQLMKTIDVLSYEKGACKTGDVLRTILDHAHQHSGGFSHHLVSSLMTAHLTDPLAHDHESLAALPDESPESSQETGNSGMAGAGSKWLAGIGILAATFPSAGAEAANYTESPGNHKNGTQCQPDKFPCADGTCIDRAKVCDDHFDCGPGDHSDELPKECPEHCEDTNRFPCKTVSQCIPKSDMCNGSYDCKDGSDETSPPCPCPPPTELCQDGSVCIPREKNCDGKKDCHDGSDERLELCQDRLNTTVQEAINRNHEDKQYLTKHCCSHEVPYYELFKHHGIDVVPCSNVSKRMNDCRSLCHTNSYVPWCATTNKYYQNGKCLYNYDLCNGRRDCKDGQDEAPDLCYYRCEPQKIPCGDRNCIRRSDLKDGHRDCGNGRDEDAFTSVSEKIRMDINGKCTFYPSPQAAEDCKTALKKTCCDVARNFVPTTTTTTTQVPSTSLITTSNSTLTIGANQSESLFYGHNNGKAGSNGFGLGFGLGAISGFFAFVIIGVTGAVCVRARYQHYFPGVDRTQRQAESGMEFQPLQDQSLPLSGVDNNAAEV